MLAHILTTDHDCLCLKTFSLHLFDFISMLPKLDRTFHKGNYNFQLAHQKTLQHFNFKRKIHQEPLGVNFIKALTLAFFYWWENASKIVWPLKHHCCQYKRFFAHFGILIDHFEILKAKFEFWNWALKKPTFFGIMLWKFSNYGYYEIEHWKRLKYFGIFKYKFWRFGFMKSTPSR